MDESVLQVRPLLLCCWLNTTTGPLRLHIKTFCGATPAQAVQMAKLQMQVDASRSSACHAAKNLTLMLAFRMHKSKLTLSG
jgi:hypothetical protein